MTQDRPAPQDIAAATFRGWGQVTKAWLDAAEQWWLTIVEWAFDEREFTGVNQTRAFAQVDDATPLRGDFCKTDGAKTPVPPSQVLIGRTTDGAQAKGGPVELVVTIRPGGVVGPGAYRGAVVDATTGAPVTAAPLFINVILTK